MEKCLKEGHLKPSGQDRTHELTALTKKLQIPIMKLSE